MSPSCRTSTHHRRNKQNIIPSKPPYFRPSNNNRWIVEDKFLPFATSTDEEIPVQNLEWHLRSMETTLLQRWKIRLAANVIRLDCFLKGQAPPKVLCPKGGKATLEAYIPADGIFQRRKKIARFGITTQRGPPSPEIISTVQTLYNIPDPPSTIGIAAIIYMFVEPPYRKAGIGVKALEIIAAIHAYQGCDFTMLVADDDGSGKLVRWYEEHGYRRAPELQEVMGSPGGKYGVSMIAPTFVSTSEFFEKCPIKWW